MTIAMVFFVLAAYCLLTGVRRLCGQRPPYYVEKNTELTPEQIRQWSRFTGFSTLIWAAAAALLGCNRLFGMWLFLVPAALCALGGVALSLKASALLHRDTNGPQR